MLFLGFSIISSVSLADTTQVTPSVVYNDVKSIGPKIEQALSALGKELKVGATAVWDILVRQQLVWSYCFLILTLISIFNWYLFYKRNFGKLKEGEYITGEQDVFDRVPNPDYDPAYRARYLPYEGKPGYTNEIADRRYAKYLHESKGKKTIVVPITKDGVFGFKYLHLTICICLSILSFLHFSDMLTGFINPEYGAMKTIAEIATQIK